MRKKCPISVALIPALSMWVALSACSGDRSDEATSDIDDYCASVEDADEICDNLEPPSPTPATDQTAGIDGWLAWTGTMF